MTRSAENAGCARTPPATLLATALLLLPFSAPAAGWPRLLFHTQIFGLDAAILTPRALGIVLAAFALLACLFPRAAPATIGRLYRLLLWIGHIGLHTGSR